MPRPQPTYTIDQLKAEFPSAKFELPHFSRDDAVRLGMGTSAVIAEWEPGLLTQGGPGVPQDPLAPRR